MENEQDEFNLGDEPQEKSSGGKADRKAWSGEEIAELMGRIRDNPDDKNGIINSHARKYGRDPKGVISKINNLVYQANKKKKEKGKAKPKPKKVLTTQGYSEEEIRDIYFTVKDAPVKSEAYRQLGKRLKRQPTALQVKFYEIQRNLKTKYKFLLTPKQKAHTEDLLRTGEKVSDLIYFKLGEVVITMGANGINISFPDYFKMSMQGQSINLKK